MNKTEFIKFKVTPAEKERIKANATEKHMSLSDHCRESSLKNDKGKDFTSPLSASSEKRKYKFEMELTSDENDLLKTLASETGLSRTGVMRQLISKAEVNIIDPQFSDELREELDELKDNISTIGAELLSLNYQLSAKPKDAEREELISRILTATKKVDEMMKQVLSIKNNIQKKYIKMLNKNKRVISNNKLRQKAKLKKMKEIQTMLENDGSALQNFFNNTDEFYEAICIKTTIEKWISQFKQIGNNAVADALTEWLQYLD